MSQHHQKNISKIVGIQFSLLSADEIRRGSVAEIKHRDTYVNNMPVIGGLFDPRMGVLEPGLICPTDGLDRIQTPGYFGHIELARPVFHIQYLNTILKILRCICFTCSKLRISKEKYKQVLKMNSEDRWKFVFALASKVKRCGEDTVDGCGCLQPLKIRKEGLASIFAEWKDNEMVIKLTPEIVLKLFKRISDDDISFMGFSPLWSRPESMICQVLLVCPPAVRPSVKHDAQQRSEDDLTNILVNIVKNNNTLQEKIKNNAPANVIEDWTTVLQYYVSTMVDNKIPGVAAVAQRSGRPLKSIKDRLIGKGGRMRGNLMAKRNDFTARSVITADPNISIRELGVPLRIAKNITKPVVVNMRNRAFLRQLVLNGPEIHPGAKMLEKRNGETLSLRYVDRESIVLEEGDIVHRHMMDGDPILFNRQPTLHRMSMMCHIVKVMSRGDTFRMNVGCTKSYNADFDGDEMNLHMPQDNESDAELLYLAAVPFQIISPANNKSIIGVFQDNLLGSYRFTRENIHFTLRDAMNLLMMFPRIKENEWKTYLTQNGRQNRVSNFDILSQILPPLTLQYKTKLFKDSEDYKTSNHVLEIRNGKYIRGQMDKGILDGHTKGLIQRICNDYGNRTSANFIDDLQNIITEYMKTSSFSVGISDLISDEKTNQEIIQKITDKKNQVKTLIDQTQLGIFQNDTGKTNEQEFEIQVNNILNQASSEAGKIGLEKLNKNNRFVIMVNAGSKGSELNISQMISCLGQQNVDGKRIPYGFEQRTLPHFSKFDDSPGARGFVESSYINGLSPQELFFHAMGGRVGLIDTAVKSVTYETQVVLIENGQVKNVPIGEWIDGHLLQHADQVQHFPQDRQLELLNLPLATSVYIPTTDEKGVVSWGVVSAVTRHDPGTRLYEIKTRGGREVTVTEGKSLLIWNAKTQTLEETPTPNIQVGDFLPITANLITPPVVISSVNMCEDTDTDTDTDTFNFTFENGRFLGIFLMDGDTDVDSQSIYFNFVHEEEEDDTNEQQNKENFIINWFNQQNIPWEGSKDQDEDEHICWIRGESAILVKFLNRFLGETQQTRIIPNEIFIAPTEFVEGLIVGLMEQNPNEILSKSRSLLEGINMLYSRSCLFAVGKITPIAYNGYSDDTLYSLSLDTLNIFNDVALDPIAEINVIGVEKHPKMYDLTIPSTLNFGLANGLQVRDTSTTGYIQRRLIKGLEDLMVGYDMTVRTNKNQIVQFVYGDDNIDTTKVENQTIPLVQMSIQEIYSHFNVPEDDKSMNILFEKTALRRMKGQTEKANQKCKEYTDKMVETREKLVRLVFKNKNDNVVHCPVAFAQIIANIQGQLHIQSHSMVDITILETWNRIESTMEDLEKINKAPPTALFKAMYFFYLSPKDLLFVKRFNSVALDLLLATVALQYKRAVVAPGEMIGMTAGQSIGETSTQMSTSYFTRNKIIVVNKVTNEVTHKSVVIGEFCDQLIQDHPELTLGTGHPDSVETLLESLEEEYYVVGVSTHEKTAWNKISHISRHPVNGQMMRVVTRSGRVVETTTSHSHLVRKNNQVVPIVGSDMREGMRIPVAKHIDNAFVQSVIKTGKDNQTHWALDDHLGWFLGVFLSQPQILEDMRIKIDNIHPALETRWNAFVSKLGKTLEYELLNFIRQTCVVESYSNQTIFVGYYISHCFRIPDFAFTAPHAFKCAFIQGYVDNQIQNKVVYSGQEQFMEIYTPQHSFAKDLAILLGYVDVPCLFKKDESHKVVIPSMWVSLYQENVGTCKYESDLTNIVKFVKRNHLKWRNKRTPFLSPNPSEEMCGYDKINDLKILIHNCIKTLKINNLPLSLYEDENGDNGDITRMDLEKYFSIFKNHEDSWLILPELRKIHQALNADVFWDEIVLIYYYQPKDKNQQFVYDFTVPGNQTFMTDEGVIIHNTLNTFHFSGVSSKSNVTRGVPRIEEILSLSSEPKNPSLTVHLKPEEETDRDKAQSIMYMIEHTRLKEIVESVEICFDPDDLHSLVEEDRETLEQYRQFESMMEGCQRNENRGEPQGEEKTTEAEKGTEKPEEEKSKWIVRMAMDATVMLEKNITMDDVHFAMKNSFRDTVHCVFSDYNADKLVFRIRMMQVKKPGGGGKKSKQNSLDQTDEIYIIKQFQDDLLENLILRGIKGINKVSLRKIKDNVMENNGTYDKKEIWALDTVGTNLLDVLGLDYIDFKRTFSNNIVEMYDTLGIEAARQSIYNEIKEVIEFDGTYINSHHFSVLCDRMTFTSKMISIFRHGINNDNIGPIAKASFEETPEMFLKAARHAELDTMRGISANVMCGQEGFFGTSAFQVVLDLEEMKHLEEVVMKETREVNKDIEEMFQLQGGVENPLDKCSTQAMSIQSQANHVRVIELGQDNEYDPGF